VHRPVAPLRTGLVPVALAVALATAGCGDDGPTVAEQRVAQIREAAAAARLPDDVADVLALAATGTTSTFRITFAGDNGSTIVVAQAPPDRRVDIVVGSAIVESRVLRDGVGYACTVPPTTVAGPGGDLECDRRAGDLRTDGVFTTEALEDFVANLAASIDDVDLAVEHRTIAQADATCLISTPKAGTSLTGTEPTAETICLSPEGAQLLVDAGGHRVKATDYATDVPDGTFDVSVGSPG
jgi:hypothetical protein